MTSRITQTFIRLQKQNRKGLVTFVMGGDPDEKTSREILLSLPEAGADIVELGIPFSDPMADGPVIQAAGLRALRTKINLKIILSLAKDFRAQHKETPLVLMGYYNPVYRYGAEKFCKDAAAAGVDGLIIVDLPPEEEAELQPHAKTYGLAFIRLVAPTTPEERLSAILKNAEGFVYLISVTGITGTKAATAASLETLVKRVRKYTSLPIAVGFGIKTPTQAKEAGHHADAAVVGSALVKTLAESESPVKAGSDFVKSLGSVLRRP